MTHVPDFPKITPIGVSGLLVSFDGQMSERGNRAALFFHSNMTSDPVDQVLETSPSLVSVFVKFDPITCDIARLETDIANRVAAHDWYEPEQSAARCWHIPSSFDGPQLGEVASLMGCSEQQVIEDVTTTNVSVLTLGFAPGQPYMGSLPESWAFPRMQGVNPQVPAGALVTAVQQLIIFANAAPTGWRHIGNVAFRCFEPSRREAIAFQPGDHVRFHQASADEIEALRSDPQGLGGARLDVLS